MVKNGKNLIIVLLCVGMLVVSSVPFAFALSISTDKSNYARGETVTVTVSGGTADGVVAIQFNLGSTVKWADQGNFSSAGVFTYQLKIPSSWSSGTYTVYAKDSYSDTGQSKTFGVALSAPSPSPPPPPPSVPPTADDVEDMPPDEAADELADADPNAAADVVEDLETDTAVDLFEAMNTTSAAAIVDEVEASAAADIFEAMNTTSAAAIVEEVSVETVADVFEEMNVTMAADVVEGVAVETASDIVIEMEDVAAAELLAEVNVTSAVAIFETVEAISEDEAGLLLDAAVDTGNEEAFADVLLNADENTTAASLLKSKPNTGGTLIEKMATKNLNAAAKRVEAAIKIKTRELDPEVREEMLAKVAEILEEVTVESLVDLFIEIVNLPDTPSTVAEVLEVMSLTKILDVVTAWIPTGDFESLSKVFDLLTVESVTSIWMGMSSAERGAVLPYLSAETAATLPELSEFEISELSVSPMEVQVNEYVSISVTVENVGIEAGDYIIRVKINGLTEVTETVSVAAGASTIVTFSVAKDEGGIYAVEADGQTDTFTVIAPEPPVPAEFVLSNLVLSSGEVSPGESVSVSVEVENIGEESGSYTVELSLDGVIVETDSVALDGGESTSVSFSLSSEDEGDHVVEVDGLSSSFTVTEPPVEPDYTWVYVLVAVLVLAAAGYYYWKRTQA